jgi:hypothetical protein
MKKMSFFICILIQFCFSQENISKQIIESDTTIVEPCNNPRFLELKARNDSCIYKQSSCLNSEEWKEYRNLQENCKYAKDAINEKKLRKSLQEANIDLATANILFNKLGNWHIFWGTIGFVASVTSFFIIANNNSPHGYYLLPVSGIAISIWEIKLGDDLKLHNSIFHKFF